MRMCLELHWRLLREAIDARGLGVLVPENGEKAAADFVDAITDGLSIDNFDPLRGAHDAIIANCMANLPPEGAIAMLSPRADGSDWCPLCFMNERNNAGNNYDGWIDLAASDQVEIWRELGKGVTA